MLIMTSIVIKNIDFETIKSIWSEYLWVNRASDIKPMSSMTYHDTYDMTIYDKYTPTFFGAFDLNNLVGVNSGHRTSTDYYRSRGLYVNPKYRKQGISTLLLNATLEQGKNENCDFCWSLPRLSSIRAYKKVGFRRVSNWSNQEFEYGPNCTVVKQL